MSIYIKKPVAIHAVKWTGENVKEMQDFIGKSLNITSCNVLTIHTLEGDHTAQIGDMIIKGVAGEFYPCKHDIFSKTYFTQEEYIKSTA